MKDHKKVLIELIEKNKLSHIQSDILSISEYSIAIKKTEKEDYTKIGSSRICGYPDLPIEIKFPRILEDD